MAHFFKEKHPPASIPSFVRKGCYLSFDFEDFLLKCVSTSGLGDAFYVFILVHAFLKILSTFRLFYLFSSLLPLTMTAAFEPTTIGCVLRFKTYVKTQIMRTLFW